MLFTSKPMDKMMAFICKQRMYFVAGKGADS